MQFQTKVKQKTFAKQYKTMQDAEKLMEINPEDEPKYRRFRVKLLIKKNFLDSFKASPERAEELFTIIRFIAQEFNLVEYLNSYVTEKYRFDQVFEGNPNRYLFDKVMQAPVPTVDELSKEGHRQYQLLLS